jgi:biotin carboxyl carrier protein
VANITIDGVRREVTLTRSSEGFVVRVDGRAFEVRDVARVDGGIAFLVGHESHVVRVAEVRDGIALSMDGRTYLRERDAIDTDRPAHSSGRGGDGRLEAPMPGSIIAVHAAPGDRVRAGQPLVVLEAMKMHNEIASPIDGVVRKVSCKVGDRVGFGQVLVEIGSEAS